MIDDDDDGPSPAMQITNDDEPPPPVSGPRRAVRLVPHTDPRHPANADEPCGEYVGAERAIAWCERCKCPRMAHPSPALQLLGQVVAEQPFDRSMPISSGRAWPEPRDPSSPILLLLRIADAAGVLVTTSDRGGSTADAMCDLRAALDALEKHFNEE